MPTDCILPGGTGYISDAGMTGPQESVLGVKPELIIRKLHEKLPVRFEVAQGPCRMDCVLFGIDEKSGQCASVERFSIW